MSKTRQKPLESKIVTKISAQLTVQVPVALVALKGKGFVSVKLHVNCTIGNKTINTQNQ